MKIALLPTGRTEWHGLPGALKNLFPAEPAHEFYVVPTAAEIRSNPDGFPYPGFTTTPLRAAHETSPPEAAEELVGRAAQEALGDRGVSPADLVIVLDDLELANSGQADRVCRVFCAAVQGHLAKLGAGGRSTRMQKIFRERVSFHLLVPMIEAIFFADPGALKTSGVPEAMPVDFAPTCDPEDFQTSDTMYLAETAAACPCWSGLPRHRQKRLRPKWLGDVDRARHPKGYLQWLCRDGEASNCTRYNESSDGGKALAGLDWAAVMRRPAEQMQYIRAFVADLEDALGQAPITGAVAGQQARDTSRFTPRTRPVLRNL